MRNRNDKNNSIHNVPYMYIPLPRHTNISFKLPAFTLNFSKKKFFLVYFEHIYRFSRYFANIFTHAITSWKRETTYFWIIFYVNFFHWRIFTKSIIIICVIIIIWMKIHRERFLRKKNIYYDGKKNKNKMNQKRSCISNTSKLTYPHISYYLIIARTHTKFP